MISPVFTTTKPAPEQTLTSLILILNPLGAPRSAGLSEKKAHATTLLIMLPLCITSFIVYMIKGSIEVRIAINVGVGFVIGGIIGALILKKINNTILKFIFGLVIIAGGIKLLI